MVLLLRINAYKTEAAALGLQITGGSICLPLEEQQSCTVCSGESTYDRRIQVNYSYQRLFHISTAANLLAWSLALLLTGKVVPLCMRVRQAQ